MRITEDEKERNRARILATAGRLFRERGIQNVGISELMREAGFTHGGFYNHFATKEALVTEVCARSVACSNATLAEALGGPHADAAWRSFVDEYLSTAHRDHPSSGCTLGALLGEAAHEPGEVQASFADGAGELLGFLAPYFCRRYRLGDEAGRRRAIEALAQILGAVTLSRATVHADRRFADEVLAVCREKLTR